MKMIADGKELIALISEIRSQYNCFDSADQKYYEALSLVLRILRHLPSEQPCDDAVSRAELLDIIERMHRITDETANGIVAKVAITAIKHFRDIVNALPSVQPQTEWNNHTVACLLAELFGDACACNYNGIDEWLPEKCEVIDACPNPVGVACWEQFLKHRAERRTDE